MNALDLIAEERRRQVEVEGFDARRDDSYYMGELARAAACYAAPGPFRERMLKENSYLWGRAVWPWLTSWWKPTPTDRVRELVKAGALIVAEIERLERKYAGEHHA